MSFDKLLRCNTTVKLVKMDKNDESVMAYSSEPLSLLSFYGKSLPKVSRQQDTKDEVSSPGSLSDDSISRQKLFLRRTTRKVKPVLGSNNTTHRVKKVKRSTDRSKRNKENSQERKKGFDNDQDSEKILEKEEKSELKRTRPMRAAFSRAAEQIVTSANKCEMQGTDDARKSPLRRIRTGSQRKAALEVARKMAETEDILRSLDDDICNLKRNFYKGSRREPSEYSDSSRQELSEYSDSGDEEDFSVSSKQNNKYIKQKEKQQLPPSPKFCEYEKAAQEKIALRKQFLQSLDIFSEK